MTEPQNELFIRTAVEKTRLIDIALAADAVACSKDRLLKLNKMDNGLREALSEARRGKLDGQPRLWVATDSVFVLRPRVRVLDDLNCERKRLEDDKKAERAALKSACRHLVALNPTVSDMSADALEFLLKQSTELGVST